VCAGGPWPRPPSRQWNRRRMSPEMSRVRVCHFGNVVCCPFLLYVSQAGTVVGVVVRRAPDCEPPGLATQPTSRMTGRGWRPCDRILFSPPTQWRPANLAVDRQSTSTFRIGRAQFRRLTTGGDRDLTESGMGLGWLAGWRQGRDERRAGRGQRWAVRRQGGEVGVGKAARGWGMCKVSGPGAACGRVCSRPGVP
jgi:hypothetical protein